MIGWIKGIFTSPKVVDDVFDKDKGLLTKFGGWVGNMSFTEEEQAELNAKAAQDVRQFVKDTLHENTDRSKARREIAVFWMKYYALMLFMAGMLYPIDKEWSEVWITLATSLSVGAIVSAITLFFFGSHALAKYQAGKKH